MSPTPRAKKVVAPYNTGHQALPDVPNGLPYGERKQLETSMSQVPMSGPGAATPTPTAAPGPPDQAALMGALQQYQPPQGDLLGDTQRPGEPVTAGLATGPGAGPVMDDPNQQDVLAWKQYLPTLEFMASQPEATMSTKQFVRRLRSMMPTTNPVGTEPPPPGLP